MIRLRSTKLLSGVSALAVVASLGAIGSASAATTFTGANLFPPFDNTAEATSIAVTAHAVMNSDSAVEPDDGNSITNDFAMSGAGDKILINDSVLTGSILNNNAIVSSNADGIDVTNFSVIVGTINNGGLLQGGTNGLEINQSVLVGGIFNNIGATITGTNNGIIILNDAAVLGGISNEGAITGTSGDGIRMTGANVDFVGGITNFASGTITGHGTNNAAIDIGFPAQTSSFVGDITNTGTIQGLGGGTGIFVNTAAFGGNIVNNQGALITATSTSAIAVRINGGAFSGNITNSGQILATDANGIGVDIAATTVFVGNVTNNQGGLIQAASTALNISSTSFQGNVTNSGGIVSNSGNAIVVSATTFTGNITNDAGGSIQAGAANTGIVLSGPAFSGNVSNSGSISGNEGIQITGAAFTGNLTNNAGGAINGVATAVTWTGAAFTGDITNNGSIIGGAAAKGIDLLGTTLTGNVANGGFLSAGTALHVGATTTVTGAITNTGTIDGNTVGILIDGIVNGGIVNSGLIDPTSGIVVNGTVGSITNNSPGTIVGTVNAINLAGANAATTITENGGLIQGRNGLTITTALRLNNTFADTFNGNGGVLDGNVAADAGHLDSMQLNPSTSFTWLRGTANSLDQFNTGGAGWVVLGAGFRGDTLGEGVTVTSANSMTNAGKVYLDDNTAVALVNNLTLNSGTTLEYFVTSNAATHGHINAGGSANLDGSLIAFVDGANFASIGGNTFLYSNIITGARSGTFADVTTTSLFFNGQAIYHPAAVDLELDRISFNNALTLTGLTQNELSVGTALEQIYTGGGFGSDFTNLYNYLLSLPGGSQSQVTAIYDELAGAEHAQVQQATLRASEPFDTAIGQRLDEAKLNLRGSGWAENGERRYADAAQQRVMSDAAPPPSGSQGLLRGSSGISIWGRGYGDWTTVDGDAEAPGYKQNAGGIVGGLDFAVGENAVVGGALGWSTNNVDFSTPGDHADFNSFQFGGYGSYGFGRFYADGQVSFAFHDVTTTRELDLGFNTFVADASYNARAWTVAGEVGTVFKLGGVNLQPMVGVNYTDASTNGFIESGAGGFSLIVADANATSFTSTIGMRASGVWTVGGMKLVPDASLAWRHEFSDDHQSFTSAFLDDPTTQFSIISSRIKPDSAVVAAGVTAGVTKGLELFVDYNGVLNSDADSHNGSAGFRATW